MLVNNITREKITHTQGKEIDLTNPIFSKILILEDCKVTFSFRQEHVKVLVLSRSKVSGSIRKTFPNLQILDIME